MTKRTAASVLMSAGIALGGVLIPAGTASAASPQTICEESGGTYTKTGSTATCTYPVGSSDNTKVTTQKGSFNSSHDENYKNPGGSYPPGQQGGNDLGK